MSRSRIVLTVVAGGQMALADDNALTNMALLALEDAVVECRYRTPRVSFAVRFALAFLWLRSGIGREPFDTFWKALREPRRVWTFSAADRALGELYTALGRDRSPAVSMAMWKRWHEHEASSSGKVNIED